MQEIFIGIVLIGIYSFFQLVKSTKLNKAISELLEYFDENPEEILYHLDNLLIVEGLLIVASDYKLRGTIMIVFTTYLKELGFSESAISSACETNFNKNLIDHYLDRIVHKVRIKYSMRMHGIVD